MKRAYILLAYGKWCAKLMLRDECSIYVCFCLFVCWRSWSEMYRMPNSVNPINRIKMPFRRYLGQFDRLKVKSRWVYVFVCVWISFNIRWNVRFQTTFHLSSYSVGFIFISDQIVFFYHEIYTETRNWFTFVSLFVEELAFWVLHSGFLSDVSIFMGNSIEWKKDGYQNVASKQQQQYLAINRS